jgi:hypothetical protein
MDSQTDLEPTVKAYKSLFKQYKDVSTSASPLDEISAGATGIARV